MTSASQLPVVKSCEGGYICSPPKDCCKQGCCYPPIPPVSFRTPTLQTSAMLNPIFLGHWYFWAAVTATVAGILCACSLWRRHSQRSFCCRNSGRDDRASEPDSNGSCYAPPHYSRCNSFHQAPPPYSEVASKPDMYPLVLSYNGYNLESNHKVTRCSTGYLMVQYFRNYIVRPVGTLSTTSTMDSLGSSFLCNAVNDANTIIPPPYSCTGSLEEVNTNNSNNPTRSNLEFPRSVSSATCNDFHLAQHSPSGCSQIGNVSLPQVCTSSNSAIKNSTNNRYSNESNQLNDNNSKEVSITTNPCYMKNTVQILPNVVDMINPSDNCSGKTIPTDCDLSSTSRTVRKLHRESAVHDYNVVDCESQEDEHNFSDLLNLSVCIPSTITQLPLGTTTSNSQSHDTHQYSVVNSITSSDISSLANLGTPDSPPRATSPTAEIRELLDKIQQLPQQRSPVPNTEMFHHESKPKSFFYRGKSKTMYMPINSDTMWGYFNKVTPANRNVCASSKTNKGWLSRSAPNTPCGNFTPNFPTSKKQDRKAITDGSPLLNENEESEDEIQRPQFS